jgi:hypothetical protein
MGTKMMVRFLLGLLTLLATSTISSPATAQQSAGPVAIVFFDQILTFTEPQGFTLVYQEKRSISFTLEWIPTGQYRNQWSQMVRATGTRGTYENPATTAQSVTRQVSENHRKACRQSFDTRDIGLFQAGESVTYLSLIGCASSDALGNQVQEVSLLMVLGNPEGFYTIQWIEKSDREGQQVILNEPLWLARLATLRPIRLCQFDETLDDPYSACYSDQQ